MTFNEFLNHCTTHGGNWTAMLFSGIREVAPKLFDEIPDRSYEFDEVAFIVNHLCEDRPHFKFNLSLNGQVIEHLGDLKFSFREATDYEKSLTVQQFHDQYNGSDDGYDHFGRNDVKPLKFY